MSKIKDFIRIVSKKETEFTNRHLTTNWQIVIGVILGAALGAAFIAAIKCL